MFVRPVREHAFVMFRPPDRYSYSYLLGLYLGDGYVGVGRGRNAGSWTVSRASSCAG